ncbi:putative peptidoglycan lipid II flippase [Prosthecobacter debontii]|uniref:Putative peptidoglycan lipid II flippase n=1 Tax=Prosthecobacter debontii TaxID=48467 RepID=A0A1T4YU69_9BACT|nr:lipid II flippase MurJ [Prosthecobacter debontii]SKB04801.1 putative peptidoglycan lipid II flippase [Prosthecobacter debontii]
MVESLRHQLSQLLDHTRKLFRLGVGSRIVSGFMLVAVLTMVSKGVSFIKDATVAHHFGTGDSLDAFLVAFGLLSFLAALAGGGLPEAFLPTYTQIAHQKGRHRALRLGVQSTGLHFISLLMLAGVCYLIAPSFINWATRGFNDEKQALAVHLMRHLLPFMVCFGMSYQLSAWLRADKHFIAASSSPMVIPFTIIGMLLIHGAEGSTVDTLVQGTVIGAILHLSILSIVMLRAMPKQTHFWQSCLRLWEPKLRHIARNTTHFLFAGGIFSSTVVVDQTMAAWLSPGSVAVLGYTEKLCGIILAVTVSPSCDVLFPYFADKVAHQDWLGLRKLLLRSAGLILALALPATLLLDGLAPWIVSLLFERGSFTASDTERVAEVLRYAALQIPFFIVSSLASRVVVAMQATQFIIWISVLGLFSNAGLNWLLMQRMGASGIALSTVLVHMISALVVCSYVLRQIRVKLKSVQA